MPKNKKDILNLRELYMGLLSDLQRHLNSEELKRSEKNAHIIGEVLDVLRDVKTKGDSFDSAILDLLGAKFGAIDWPKPSKARTAIVASINQLSDVISLAMEKVDSKAEPEQFRLLNQLHSKIKALSAAIHPAKAKEALEFPAEKMKKLDTLMDDLMSSYTRKEGSQEKNVMIAILDQIKAYGDARSKDKREYKTPFGGFRLGFSRTAKLQAVDALMQAIQSMDNRGDTKLSIPIECEKALKQGDLGKLFKKVERDLKTLQGKSGKSLSIEFVKVAVTPSHTPGKK